MEVGKLTVEYRNQTGKAMARKLRQTGKIPAICYGPGQEPLPLALEPRLLSKALDPVKKANTVISLTVTGAPNGTTEMLVMLRDHQEDPLRGELTHADFIRVEENRDVHAIVPVVLTGKAEGVKQGGIMHFSLHKIELACRPALIPAKIEVDVTNLNLGSAIHVSDLSLGEGVRALTDAHASICSVTAPQKEKVEAVAEVPAAGAAAAPAAGAAAPAAGAAAAPAASGDKKAAGGDKKPAGGGDKKK
jgi:large subunit ribosomal protein L25